MKRIVKIAGIIFLLMNVVAIFHAYKFTHFASAADAKTRNPEQLSLFHKVKTLAFGVNNPRPQNLALPTQPFTTVKLESNKQIEAWHIKTDSAKGTVIIFHGYSGYKSSMLEKSDEFLKMGYSTLLVDFMGSGGSEGNQTTIGFKEAEQVKTAVDYLSNIGEEKIFLFGTSMGAVAVMKSISDFNVAPRGIIIECPFGSMYQTTCARFRNMNAPVFPMASLLVFWGGVQNGFWAFGHNPTEYAKRIECPTLLLYGALDKTVSKKETAVIFSNLQGEKTLKVYPSASHENYLIKHRVEWVADVSWFLNKQ